MTKFPPNMFTLKDRTCIGYDNVIVIVLVLVWLTFVSLYPIVKVKGKVT